MGGRQGSCGGRRGFHYPLSYTREATTPHAASPLAGLGTAESCSPSPATDSNQLLLSDVVQIFLIFHPIAQRKT